jgi:uncharacterized membrane protein YphA (DoxX/SURF4 family)
MPGSRDRAAGTAALLLVQAVVGYEWLVSGLTKAFHGDFPHGLAAQLRGMGGGAAWYRAFLNAVALPHAVLFGYAIEIGEIAAGVVLLAAVLPLPMRLRPHIRAAAVAALVAGVVLVANFALAHGSTFGLSLASDSFDEGVDLDTLLIGLQLALLVFALARVREARGQEPISNSRRTSLRLVLRSVCSLRQPTISAHAIWKVPAGNSFGLVPGKTTARGGT